MHAVTPVGKLDLVAVGFFYGGVSCGLRMGDGVRGSEYVRGLTVFFVDLFDG